MNRAHIVHPPNHQMDPRLLLPPVMAKTPVPPRQLVIYAALLSVSLVNTGYNVLTKQVLSAHKSGAHDTFASGSSSESLEHAPSTKADPLIFSMLRDCAAFPLLQFGAMLVDGAVLPRARDIPMIALFGLTGMFGNQFLFIYGLAGPKIPATEASVLSMTQPVFAAFLALGAGQQRPSWLLFFGVLFTFGGSIVMARVWTVHHIFSDDAIRLGSLLLGASSISKVHTRHAAHVYPSVNHTWRCLCGMKFLTRRIRCSQHGALLRPTEALPREVPAPVPHGEPRTFCRVPTTWARVCRITLLYMTLYGVRIILQGWTGGLQTPLPVRYTLYTYDEFYK